MAKKKGLEGIAFKRYGITLHELLKSWYWDKNLSQRKIAEILGVTPATICLNFSKYSIPKKEFNYWDKVKHSEATKKILSEKLRGKKRSIETKKKMSEARKGKSLVGKCERFQGKRNRSDGYIQTYLPEHPHAAKEGYVMEHRLIMEKLIGRLLKPEESVHHINHNRKDNRPENLHLFKNNKEHMRFHMFERHGKGKELKYEYQ